MIDEAFLTTEEVLEYLHVNLRTLYRLIKAGRCRGASGAAMAGQEARPESLAVPAKPLVRADNRPQNRQTATGFLHRHAPVCSSSTTKSVSGAC